MYWKLIGWLLILKKISLCLKVSLWLLLVGCCWLMKIVVEWCWYDLPVWFWTHCNLWIKPLWKGFNILIKNILKLNTYRLMSITVSVPRSTTNSTVSGRAPWSSSIWCLGASWTSCSMFMLRVTSSCVMICGGLLQ